MIRSILQDFIQKNEPFMTMVMESPIMIIIYKGPDFTIDFANKSVQGILGRDWEEIKYRPFFDLYPGLKDQGYKDIYEQVVKSGETYTAHEMMLQISPERGIEYVSFTIHPFKDDNGQVTSILGIATDVTELVKSRQLIQENEEKYRGILEGTAHGFSLLEILFDDNNKPYDYIFLEVNPAFEKIIGINNVVGKSIKEIAPEIEDFWIETYGGVALNGVSVSVVHEAKQFNSIYEAHAFRIGGDESRKVAILFTDISDRVEKDNLAKIFAEELKKQVTERTRQLKETIFELRQFAHVMSHDLKEPIRKNKFFLSLLQMSLSGKLTEKESGYLNKLLLGYERMEGILEGVLNYSKAEIKDPDCLEVDLNETFRVITDDLELIIESKNAKVTVEHLPYVKGISLLIYQLFYNLIFNSLKFARDDIPCDIYINAKSKKIGKNRFAIIFIKDNGIGFDPTYRDKIFKAFTRLHPKDEFEGSGMGLAISKKIVRQHGGSISAESAPGQGSIFQIILPMY